MIEDRASGILQRVYHEDGLLAQRTVYFVSATAFLVVGFSTLVISRSSALPYPTIAEYAVIGFGLFLAYFQMAMGVRTHVAILFWREYERSGAQRIRDSDLEEFYRNGWVVLPDGCVLAVPSNVRLLFSHFRDSQGPYSPSEPVHSVQTMDRSFPWNVVRSTNRVTSYYFPCTIAFFWIALSFSVSGPTYSSVPVVGVLTLVATLAAFGWTWLSEPWFPLWIGREQGE